MNNDFYSIQVSSPRKTALLKAGVSRDKIRRERDGNAIFGRNVYPRYRYCASVGFAEANGNPDAVAAPWRDRGLTVAVKYVCRD